MKIMKYTRTLLLVGVFYLSGCSDFLDINKDPNNPTDAQLNQILPAAQFAMGYNLGGVTGGLSNAASTFVHQVVNFRVDQYGIDGTYVNNTWNGMFANAMNNFEIMIHKAEAQGDLRYAGVAKVCKAYSFSVMVDLFGDIPFSEALQGAGNEAPHYEDDAAVYAACIALLDEAKTDLAATSGLSPGTDDIFYNGDINRWRRLANTLQLKLYNNIRKVQDVTAQVAALRAGGDLMGPTDGFEMAYGTGIQPPNRNPSYLAEYAGAGRESFVSRWFFDIMVGNNANILTGVADPRVPYYFFHQKPTGAAEANANYQDGRFVTRQFGTTLPNNNVTNTQTLHGLYPIGGRYDDGLGGTGNTNSGPGNVGQRLLPYFNRKFIEAEYLLDELNDVAGARVELDLAVRAAFTRVNAIAAAVPASVQVVPQISVGATNTYVAAVLAAYDAAPTQARQLEIIMTQKWIANYGYGIDAYTDYRRTGYPILFDVNTDNDPSTISAFPYALRFPYRDLDLDTNPNAPDQPNIYEAKIFWQEF
jgi:hypothetical protein